MDKDTAILELRKKGIQVHPVHSMIVLPERRVIGMSVWGLIDFLKNNYEFSVTTKKRKKNK